MSTQGNGVSIVESRDGGLVMPDRGGPDCAIRNPPKGIHALVAVILKGGRHHNEDLASFIANVELYPAI